MNAYKRYKNRLEKFLQTERGKRFINFVYSIGAAIVILGAMFKLLHFPFGNELLLIGMITEVIVFTLSAFDTPIRDYSWEKVFPVLTSEKKIKNNISNQFNQISDQEDQQHQINPSPQTEKYNKQLENLAIETEKMTKQIQELNDIYSKMLKAMSVNRDK